MKPEEYLERIKELLPESLQNMLVFTNDKDSDDFDERKPNIEEAWTFNAVYYLDAREVFLLPQGNSVYISFGVGRTFEILRNDEFLPAITLNEVGYESHFLLKVWKNGSPLREYAIHGDLEKVTYHRGTRGVKEGDPLMETIETLLDRWI